MKYARITEKDPHYISTLTGLLVQLGARPTDQPTVFEVEDDLDLDYYGLEVSTQAPTDHGPEIQWLEAYRGNFDFYLSLQNQWKRRGNLSAKQWETISRAVERDKKRSEAVSQPQEFSIHTGDILVVSQFAARLIAEQTGARVHYVLEVVKVLRETAKAYQVIVKLSAARTSHCGICGITLTNPESVARGIGPICADNWGIGDASEPLAELAKKLDQVIQATACIPKKCVKQVNGIDQNKPDESAEQEIDGTVFGTGA